MKSLFLYILLKTTILARISL